MSATAQTSCDLHLPLRGTHPLLCLITPLGITEWALLNYIPRSFTKPAAFFVSGTPLNAGGLNSQSVCQWILKPTCRVCRLLEGEHPAKVSQTGCATPPLNHSGSVHQQLRHKPFRVAPTFLAYWSGTYRLRTGGGKRTPQFPHSRIEPHKMIRFIETTRRRGRFYGPCEGM